MAAAWAGTFNDEREGTSPRILQVISSFASLEGNSIYTSFQNHSQDFKETPHSAYVVGAPARYGDPFLYPVTLVCLSMKLGQLVASVRMVTFYELEQAVRGIGWRLEQGDPSHNAQTGAWNGTSHVQRIRAWQLNGDPGFFQAADEEMSVDQVERASHLNESKPAFAIPALTPAGLLVAAMGSLYGASATRTILESQALSGMAAELDAILGA